MVYNKRKEGVASSEESSVKRDLYQEFYFCKDGADSFGDKSGKNENGLLACA
jgi:hypothetical protein